PAQTVLHETALLEPRVWTPHSFGATSLAFTHVPLQAGWPLQLSVTATAAVARRPLVSKKTAWKVRVSASAKSMGSVWFIWVHESTSENAPFCVPASNGP